MESEFEFVRRLAHEYDAALVAELQFVERHGLRVGPDGVLSGGGLVHDEVARREADELREATGAALWRLNVAKSNLGIE